MRILIFSLLLCTAACEYQDASDANAIIRDDNINDDDDNNHNDNGDDNIGDNGDINLKICSDLKFDHVSWPKGLSEAQVNAFALGINITGSFEGHHGWENISNNFDGQGLSLGLFNQNFGQGTLQPLLIRLWERDKHVVNSVFSSSQRRSLHDMLEDWQGAAIASKAIYYDPFEENSSELDMPEHREITFNAFLKGAASNAASVTWAKNNLYTSSSGKTFKSEWKKALQEMAGTPEYISHQIYAADRINQKAISLMKEYGGTMLRTYLFFFDIVVQNGGIQSSVKDAYLKEIKKKPGLGEYTRMTILLKHRLTKVIAKYRKDVESRKMSILNGSGTVHGSKRDFRIEHCVADWRMPYDSEAILTMP